MHDIGDLPWYRRLYWQVLIGMVLGVLTGLLFGPAVVPKLDWIRELFMKLLRMVIVPLVVTSIISGVASVGSARSLGRLFSKTLGYYLLSSGLAAMVGLVLVNLIKPGVGANITGAQQEALPELQTPSSPVQILLDIVPENFFAALGTPDMLAIIFFCIVIGAAIATLPEQPQKILTDLVGALFEAMMRVTGWVIALVPLGVFAMMAVVVGRTGFDSFEALALYMVTIASGLTVHLFVVLPLLLLLLGGIKPWIHFRNMREPLLIAFSTSSSLATLPVTMRAVEKKVGVSNRISSFVLPMGSTVNMDGTALYECAGVIFIAQVMGADLSILQQALIVMTALLASIGAAAVPSAGLVVIFIVLEAVNLRGPEVELIVGAMLAIDRPLDMFRTSVNIFSDSCGAAIIARSEGEEDVDTKVAAGD